MLVQLLLTYIPGSISSLSHGDPIMPGHSRISAPSQVWVYSRFTVYPIFVTETFLEPDSAAEDSVSTSDTLSLWIGS